MLEITDAAVKQFKKILSLSDVTDSDIKIFISGGRAVPPAGLV